MRALEPFHGPGGKAAAGDAPGDACADLVLELPRRLFREGQHQDLRQFDLFRLDQDAQDQMLDGVGLARARRGLQQAGFGQVQGRDGFRALLRILRRYLAQDLVSYLVRYPSWAGSGLKLKNGPSRARILASASSGTLGASRIWLSGSSGANQSGPSSASSMAVRRDSA